MKALINKKQLSNRKAKAAPEGDANPFNMNYDFNKIEFVGTKKDPQNGMFGKKGKELFIFKIKDNEDVSKLSGDGAEAFLVIACG